MADDEGSPTSTAAELDFGALHLLRALRRVDEAAGLTPARLSALSVLVFGGPCTLGRLAEIEDAAGPTMTRIVDERPRPRGALDASAQRASGAHLGHAVRHRAHAGSGAAQARRDRGGDGAAFGA
jgi:hypothetical protein